MRIPFDSMAARFQQVLEGRGFDGARARQAALLFAGSSADGVYSHGINRFPRVVEYIERGFIDPAAEPRRLSGCGGMERWDGRLGLGCLNAAFCMDRACDLAREHGIALVALGNTNHWMRGGAYGWQAAQRGFMALCFTNTMPNMPAWGATDRRLGNNPLVFALPRENGAHVVLDCAMSQFAYGKLEEARLARRPLPVPGGYDKEGRLTTDPAAIEETGRVLPIGYWKGSGLSTVLDLAAAALSGAGSVRDVGARGPAEYGLSQVFIAINPGCLGSRAEMERGMEETLGYVKASAPTEEGGEILYPGERALRTREENMARGIPVDAGVWERVMAL